MMRQLALESRPSLEQESELEDHVRQRKKKQKIKSNYFRAKAEDEKKE